MPIFKVRDDLCLAFANTRYWRGTATPAEELHDFATLLAWIERSAVVGENRKSEFAAAPHDLGTGQVSELFAEAIALREAMFHIFSAFATGTDVARPDLARLEAALAAAPPRDALAHSDAHYGWRVPVPLRTMPQLLAPVIWSAGDLIVTAGNRRIRRCANHECLWLFVDASKSGTRRWCQMSACGNRAKARRHYSKIKGR